MDVSRADAGDEALRADEVERLRQALEEEQQRNLRLLADFDNLRRRVARESEAARGEARRAALLPLLPVLDSLERALAAGSTDTDFYEGVAATRRLFERALREAGAEPLESVGQPFDPSVHEALATVASDGRLPRRSSGSTASSRESTIPTCILRPSGRRPPSGSRRSTRPTRS